MGNIKVFKKKNSKSIVGNKVKKLELFNNFNQLKTKYYYKLVCEQDIIRTPSISIYAVKDFFNLNLEGGSSVLIDLLFENTIYSVELNKRRTRQEYRFFINRIKDDIAYDVDDVLSFHKENSNIHLNIIKKGQYKYVEIIDKMKSKLHLLD